jgi:hypothetical protein
MWLISAGPTRIAPSSLQSGGYIYWIYGMRFHNCEMAIVFHTRAAPRIGQGSSKGMCSRMYTHISWGKERRPSFLSSVGSDTIRQILAIFSVDPDGKRSRGHLLRIWRLKIRALSTVLSSFHSSYIKSLMYTVLPPGVRIFVEFLLNFGIRFGRCLYDCTLTMANQRIKLGSNVCMWVKSSDIPSAFLKLLWLHWLRFVRSFRN